VADLDISNPLGFQDKRVGRGNSTTSNQAAEYANFATIAAKKARLTALAASSYTASRLATMSANDLDYALRLASADAAGIK
jgi:hypothetical protein